MIPEGRSPKGIAGFVTLTSIQPTLRSSNQPHTAHTNLYPLFQNSPLRTNPRKRAGAATEYHSDDRTVAFTTPQN